MRRFAISFVCLITSFFLAGSFGSYAQQKPDPDRAQYSIAKQYEAIGDFDKALNIYLVLLNKNPQNFTYFDAASRCYISLKRYDDLIQLIETKLKTEPRNVQFQIRLGEAYLQKDEKERAHQIWNGMLDKSPQNASVYRMVANSLMKNRLYDRGIEVYLKGRAVIGKPELFALELAQLHSYRFNYDWATDEYLRYLKASPRQLNYIEARIASFKGEPETYQQVTSVLNKWISTDARNPAYRKLLISVLLRHGNFSEAFAEVKGLEKVKLDLKSKEIAGEELFKFSQIALKESRYDYAENSLETIVKDYPGYPDRPRIEYELARTLHQQNRFDQALSTFERVAREYPNSIWATEAILARGDIFLNEQFRPDSAAQSYLNIIDNFPDNKNLVQAYIRLGDVDVARGNLLEAETYYLKAVGLPSPKGTRSKENKLEGSLRLAELAFFQGDFAKTRRYLKSLLEVPAGDLSNEYVNDALELSLLLDRNEQSAPEALTQYAQAMLLIKQHDAEKASQALRRLSELSPEANLSPKAMFQYGSLKRQMGDFVAAILGFQSLINQYPENTLCDLALWQIGIIYEEDLREPAKAIEGYETILVKYSESMLVEDARKKVRSLEAKP